VATPHQALTIKTNKFDWTSVHNGAFNDLKQYITSLPCLALFDPHLETILKTDASTLHGLGAALFQKHGKIERPVAFISRFLSKPEKNYTTNQLELTAIVWALQKLRQYCYAVPIKILTDCHSLCWILHAKKKELTPS